MMFLCLDQGWSKIPTCATREVCCRGRPGGTDLQPTKPPLFPSPGVDWLHFLLPGETS